jgi:arabinoxylan arabinofuranohydrolase
MKSLLFSLFVLASSSLLASEGGFLFVTFKGEQTPMTEQIYFALSQDGRHWDALNGGNPVLISTLGEKGVRDPFILRSQDGKKFYILATDLSVHYLHGNWGRSVREGSKSIVIWESTDLLHWSAPRLVKVAADDAGCTWAPEAIYDEQTHDYLVFWASKTKSDNFGKHRIWAARTTDFQTFSKPFVYIDKPQDVIDTDIVRENGRYYRFSKDEKNKAITMEVSDKLMGPWQEMPGFSLASMTGYEGPECYQIESGMGARPATWCLILDCYSKGTGYHPFITTDLSKGEFKPGEDFSFPFHFRHGAILALSSNEYQRLKSASF